MNTRLVLVESPVVRSDAVAEQTVLVDVDTVGGARVRLAKPVLDEDDVPDVSKSAVQVSIAESLGWDHTPEQNRYRCPIVHCRLSQEHCKHLTDSALC